MKTFSKTASFCIKEKQKKNKENRKKRNQIEALDWNRGKGVQGSDGTLAEQKFGENDRKEREQWIQLFPVESRRGERISWLRQDLQAAGATEINWKKKEKRQKSLDETAREAATDRGFVASPRPRPEAWRARRKVYKKEARAQESGLAIWGVFRGKIEGNLKICKFLCF